MNVSVNQTRPSASDDPMTGRRGADARRILVLLLLVVPLSQLGLDIYTPALPQIMRDFGAPHDVVQNTVTAYMLGMSAAFIPMGLISDALGRRKVLLAGLSLLVAASVGCALATSVPMLMGFRFLQGIGGGSCLLLAAIVAADCFRGTRLVSVVAVVGAAWAGAPVLAPVLGGYLVQAGSWRLVFGFLALLAASVALLVARLMPETLRPDSRTPVNPRAAARVIGSALRHRVFMGFVAMFALMAVAQMSFGVDAPFLYQSDLGYSPTAYGMIALLVGVATLIGQLACGALASRTSTRRLGFSAAAVLGAGAAVLVIVAAVIGVNAVAITVGAALVMLGCGVLNPQAKGLSLGVFRRNLGLISGLVSTCAYLVVSAAMALLAWLPDRSSAPLGWLYLATGSGFVVLMVATTSRRRTADPRTATVTALPRGGRRTHNTAASNADPRLAPIAVIDSGVGGLTVTKAIIDRLPGEAIRYVADTANCPYGSLSIAEIRSRTLALADELVSRGAKALVIACNSASAATLRDARQRYDVPVVEVVVPTARRAAATTRSGRIGIIATEATIASGAYHDALAVIPGTVVTAAACPSFVDFVEAGITSGRALLRAAAAYLEPLRRADIDTLVLGCTHYPLLSDVIRKVIGEDVTVVSGSEETAEDVYRVLAQHNLLRPDDAPQGRRLFETTGDPEAFASLTAGFIGDVRPQLVSRFRKSESRPLRVLRRDQMRQPSCVG